VRGAHSVAGVLSGMAASDELGKYPAFAPERITDTTRFFLDLVVARLLLRALLGENPKKLRSEIGAHVKRSVPFFIAGCRDTGTN